MLVVISYLQTYQCTQVWNIRGQLHAVATVDRPQKGQPASADTLTLIADTLISVHEWPAGNVYFVADLRCIYTAATDIVT